MSTNPAAEPSQSVTNPEITASPTSAKVLNIGEGAAGATEPKHSAIREALASKTWQLATLIMPILLTTWLTFWVSQKEDNLKRDIDQQSQLFSQQLQLSEELYKRRFDAYDKLYAQLVQLNTRLHSRAGAETGTWNKVNADQVAQFNESLDLSKLHMSRKVEELTPGAWLAGARGDGELLSQSIRDLEVAMKTELDNWMLEEKGAPTAENATSKPRKAKPVRRAQ